VPQRDGMYEPRLRARILHALANHELQATELFAWALLAFPEAPPAFRYGLVDILTDEQRHTRMYLRRTAELGGRFGSEPASGYFWNKVPYFTSPARFVCAMSLTFENANLDHTADYAGLARAAGDERTARIIEAIGRDEERHVAFGGRWLRHFKSPGDAMWDAYRANLTWPLRPAKARGATFNRDGRERAGLDAAFIDALEHAEP